MEARYLCERVERICQDKLSKGCDFLDVGCGPGDLVAELKKRYSNSIIAGVDPSRYNASEARDKYNLDIFEGHWGDYSGGKFDVITFFGNLMLHSNPKESLSKAYSFLNPNGILIFDVKNPENSTRKAMVKLKKYLPDNPKIRQFYWHAFHGMPWGLPKEELQSFLIHLGFRGIKVSGHSGRTASLNGHNGTISRISAYYDKLIGNEAWLEFSLYK